ncbi:VOC family protein [Amycolatopsis sp. lyj-112]|uniref:VOC family protein n=1 Tax=Amycolatopsis sp. lyj-112 TaxID=2789288 RepID=UPI00397A5B08
MTVLRLEQIGIVVRDLTAAKVFFIELGLELEGEATVGGGAVDRINGIEGVQADIAVMRTPDGHGKVELIKWQTPSALDGDQRTPPNTPGLRHIMFSVDDIEDVLGRLRPHGAELVGELVRYEDSYRLAYIRGPEGIIIELAEKIT